MKGWEKISRAVIWMSEQSALAEGSETALLNILSHVTFSDLLI